MSDDSPKARWRVLALGSTLFWLLILIAGLIAQPVDREFINVWFAAGSGGVGTVAYILTSIRERWSTKRGFTQRYFLFCLTQPILGVVMGAIIYGIGDFLASFILGQEKIALAFWDNAILIVLSWIVGYHFLGRKLFAKYAVEL